MGTKFAPVDATHVLAGPRSHLPLDKYPDELEGWSWLQFLIFAYFLLFSK